MVPQRITLICNSYPPEIGAAPVRMHGLAQLLCSAGHDVTVITGMPSYPLGRVFAAYRGRTQVTEQHDGVTVHRLPYLPSQSSSRLLRLGSLATLSAALLFWGSRHLRQSRPDVVVVSSPPLPLARVGALLARNAGARLLLNVSDLWPLTAKELGAIRPGFLYRRLEALETALFRKATAWMGQSEEILAYMRRHAGGSKPAFLYRNLPRLSAAVQETPPPAHQPRRLVYAGLLGPVQCIAQIATETDFAALGLELHLYGDGPERARLEAFARQYPQRGLVVHPSLPSEAMTRQLQAYDAALVPLRRPIHGAIPSKLFAAIHAGLPVVFHAGGEGADLVREHGLGWTAPPGDTAALVCVLKQLRDATAGTLAGIRARCEAASHTVFSSTAQDEAFLRFFEAHFGAPAAQPSAVPATGVEKIRAVTALIISAILALFQKL